MARFHHTLNAIAAASNPKSFTIESFHNDNREPVEEGTFDACSPWMKGVKALINARLERAAQQACERADQDGWTELIGGVYLNSRESIQEEQAYWDEEDGAKRVDFSHAPYWLTLDCGQEPVAINGAKDANLLWVVFRFVSVDERQMEIHENRQKLQRVAALAQRPAGELATAQQVQAKRQAYGRAM